MSFLLRQFDKLFDTTESVKELKKLILDMAFKGKLSPQDYTDEPAGLLLEKIKAEKEKLIKDKKIKKERSLPLIAEDEIPYVIPQNWEWARLQEVYDVRDGTHDTPKYVEQGIPLITSRNISGQGLDLTNVNYISIEDHEFISQRSKVENGDILFAMIGSIGNPTLVETDQEFSIKNVALFKYYNHNLVSKKYLLYYLTKAAVEMQSQALGGVQKFVSLGLLRSFLIPIAPLKEQQRIVEMVDHLLSLCEKLIFSLDCHSEAHKRFNNSVFQQMSSANTQNEYNNSLRYIVSNFDMITNNSESIGFMREAILNSAVKGKLVPQDPNDEPANVLIERIQAEKEQLIKEKKIKKEKSFLEITDYEIPYDLPAGWKWVRFQDVLYEIKYGTSKKCEYETGSTPVLRIPNIKNGAIDLSDLKYADFTETELEELALESDDLLMIRSNGSSSLVGRIAHVLLGAKGFAYAGYLVRLRIARSYINIKYLLLVFNSQLIRDQIEMPIRTTSGVKNINTSEISKLVFPVPPINEQKRIADKVEQLMFKCESLEKGIQQSIQDSELLMKSVLHEALLG